MAYVELEGNSLPPLPRLPIVKEGTWVVYNRDDYDDDNELVLRNFFTRNKERKEIKAKRLEGEREMKGRLK